MANDFSGFMNKVGAFVVLSLRQEFAILKLIPKDVDNISARVGQSFPFPLPVAIAAETVTPAATAPANTDTTVPTVNLAITNWKMGRFHLTVKEAAEIEAGRMFIPHQVAEAVRTVLFEINASILAKYKKFYGYSGTAGTNPFATNTNPLSAARKVLNRQLCPRMPRHMLLSHNAEESALNLASISESLKRGNSDALDEGKLGNLFGFGVRSDSQIPTHTAGVPGGTPLMVGIHALGVKALAVDGLTATTGTYLDGDIISIAGVTGTYVVTANATADGSGVIAVAIEPGLEQACADNAAVTLRATHEVNLGFNDAAFGLVIRPLADDVIPGAPTIEKSIVITDSETGVSLCLSYIPGWKSAQWAISVCWGTEVLDRRRGVRMAG